MKLIITDTYPENGEKTFVIDSIYMDRLISFLDSGVPLPDRAAELLRAPVQTEQKCPYCEGAGLVWQSGWLQQCGTCLGTGISTRSVGG